MTKQLEEQRSNFLLDLREALKSNQLVIMILHNSEKNEYLTLINGYDAEFDDVLNAYCKLPFLGRIKPQDAFEDWREYCDDVTLAEVYGFELEDGMVQIAILDSYITPLDEINIHEACCSEKLTSRLFDDGYSGDIVDGEFVSLACAMRWLREVRGVYINIRMTYWEHDNNFDPKPHFMTDICYRKTGRYYDNDIWEETYEKCAEAAINYYYDYIEKKL